MQWIRKKKADAQLAREQEAAARVGQPSAESTEPAAPADRFTLLETE